MNAKTEHQSDAPRPAAWQFAALDTIQARNHQRAAVQVRAIAAAAQQARLDACLQAWRSKEVAL